MKLFFPKKTLCQMTVIFFLFLCTQSAFAAKGSGKKPQAAPDEKGKPSIQVKETFFSFGESLEGSTIEHDFFVKNAGKAVLNIDRVRVS
ncbi:MAG: hypothetical protein AB9866_27900 [Syntrophobacteraceae bacterium]